MTTPADTLAIVLRSATVDQTTLRRRYGPNLAIIRRVLGVVPNHFAYLEIWPVGMRTCNLLVPNFLNLPFLLYGAGPPKATVGLVMYAASRAAGCGYCTAHSCSFAMARGAGEKDVVRVPDRLSVIGVDAGRAVGVGVEDAAVRGGDFDPTTAALDVADAMSRVPGEVTAAQRDALLAAYSKADAEWLVLAAAMMGFLNKFMDAMGMPLEPSMFVTAQRVIGPSGWAAGRHRPLGPVPRTTAPPQPDTLGSKLALVPVLPAVVYRDKRWSAGVPAAWPTVGEYLRARAGYAFPVLGRLGHARARRALATIVRDNTDPANSVLGLPAKYLAGLAYATAAGDEELAAASRTLAGHLGVTTAQLDGDPEGLDGPARAALALARAASGSPATVDAEVVGAAAADLTPPMIVELLVWLGVLQILHRLNVFYRD